MAATSREKLEPVPRLRFTACTLPRNPGGVGGWRATSIRTPIRVASVVSAATGIFRDAGGMTYFCCRMPLQISRSTGPTQIPGVVP